MISVLAAYDLGGWLFALLGWSLKASLILSLTGLLALAAHRNSAAFRHHLWLGASLAILVMPIATAVLPAWDIEPVNALLPSPSLTELTEPSAVIPGAPPRGQEADRADAVAQPHLWQDVALTVYLMGVVAMLLRLLAASVHTYWLTRSTQAVPAHLVTALQDCQRRLGLRRSVRLVVSRRATIAFTTGWLRPAVVLPVRSADGSSAQLETTLLHELAHIRRGDLLSMASIALLLAGQWFNPLMWYARRRLQIERECAADDLVLQLGVRSSDYAEHLLTIAKGLHPTQWASPLTAAMARPKELEGRLMAILDTTRTRRALSVRQTAVVSGLFVAMLIGAASFTAQAQTPPVKPVQLIAAPTVAQDEDNIRKTITMFYDAAERRDWDAVRKCMAPGASLETVKEAEHIVVAGVPKLKLWVPADFETSNWKIVPNIKSINIVGDSATVSQALTLTFNYAARKDPVMISVSDHDLSMVRIQGQWLVSSLTEISELHFATCKDSLKATPEQNR